MLGYCCTATQIGAQVITIQVEAKSRPGKPKFHIIGLGDGTVKESRDRITAALKASGFDVPDQILVNLAPADVKKCGSGIEVAIAWAILTSTHQAEMLDSTWLFGELSLDGTLKAVRGIAGLVSEAALQGVKRVVVPRANAREASLVTGVEVLGIECLRELPVSLKSDWKPDFTKEEALEASYYLEPGFEDVHGQEQPKRAFEIAAAGGHNILLIGPPGCGKSMLASRFASLLPELRSDEKLAIAQIASSIGEPIDDYLRGKRPFRSPHHVISEVGLIGGGADLRPGEVSFAHGGVLFLDEFPEFSRRTIEALRAPLEARKVTITRAVGSTTYPASFLLVAAMNPCPCGRLGVQGTECRCSRAEIGRYLKKLSQPILERIDLHVEAEPVPVETLTETRDSERVAVTEDERRSRVREAIHLQLERQGTQNSSLDHEALFQSLSIPAKELLRDTTSRSTISARVLIRCLRVARTVADLEGSKSTEERHLLEARSFQALERVWRYVEGR